MGHGRPCPGSGGSHGTRRRHIDNGSHDHALWRSTVIDVFLYKLDGYRAIAFKSGGKIHLRSRNDNDLSVRYAPIAKALQAMPDETVIDGEIVAMDEEGRPSFNLLQNYGSWQTPIIYYAFDVMVLSGKDVMGESLETR